MAEELDKKQVRYEIEPFKIQYQLSGSLHWYLPDFYLPETNEIVEIKSTYTFKNDLLIEHKLQATKNQGYKVTLLQDGILIPY